jgi:hypothetical protein
MTQGPQTSPQVEAQPFEVFPPSKILPPLDWHCNVAIFFHRRLSALSPDDAMAVPG